MDEDRSFPSFLLFSFSHTFQPVLSLERSFESLAQLVSSWKSSNSTRTSSLSPLSFC